MFYCSDAESFQPATVLIKDGNPAVPVRTPAEQPIRLYSWTLRFFDSEDMIQPSAEAADAHLASLLKGEANAAAATIPDLQELLSTAGTQDATPWYTAYRDEYFRMLRFGRHETQDNPVACELSIATISLFIQNFPAGGK